MMWGTWEKPLWPVLIHYPHANLVPVLLGSGKRCMPSVTSLNVPSGSFELFSNFNGTVKDDFSEFDNLRASKKPGRLKMFSI